MEYLEKEIHSIGDKVDEMYIALLGSPLTKDGGLIKRVADLEETVESIRLDIEKVKANSFKINFQQRLIWGLGSSILTGLVIFIIEKIFGK